MSWIEGTQRRPPQRFRSNGELAKMEGFLEEEEAKLALYEFLRNNITFATELLMGIKLFPFQHMADNNFLWELIVWNVFSMNVIVNFYRFIGLYSIVIGGII